MSTNISTQALHSGHDTSKTQGTRSVPIYQSSAYVFDSTEQAAGVFSLAEPGYIYTRLNNPTNEVLEQRLAAIEGGIGAVSFASGASAISTALLTLLKSGDHIVASNSLYGGTYNLLKVTLPRLGITTTFVDPSDTNNFFEASTEKTRLFFSESIGNPKLDVVDIEAIAAIAKGLKIPYFVDNTVASPALLNPLKHGANVVIHSLTKYISGHGNSLGGAIIDGGTFDWKNDKFPEFNSPSAGYHGLIYSDVLGNASYLAKLRIEGLRDFGGALSPFNSFQIIQGLETLTIRIAKHSENALKVAEYLESLESVAWVNYPGLASSKYHTLAKKYLPNGQSGVVTFGLKSGYEGAKSFVNATQLFSLLANIGDTKSLIIHPASTTHQQLTAAEQESTGVTADLIRLSIGIEAIEDIITDINQAIEVAQKTVTNLV